MGLFFLVEKGGRVLLEKERKVWGALCDVYGKGMDEGWVCWSSEGVKRMGRDRCCKRRGEGREWSELVVGDCVRRGRLQ